MFTRINRVFHSFRSLRSLLSFWLIGNQGIIAGLGIDCVNLTLTRISYCSGGSYVQSLVNVINRFLLTFHSFRSLRSLLSFWLIGLVLNGTLSNSAIIPLQLSI